MKALSLQALNSLFYNPPLTLFQKISLSSNGLLASPSGKSKILPRTLFARIIIRQDRYSVFKQTKLNQNLPLTSVSQWEFWESFFIMWIWLQYSGPKTGLWSIYLLIKIDQLEIGLGNLLLILSWSNEFNKSSWILMRPILQISFC